MWACLLAKLSEVGELLFKSYRIDLLFRYL